MILLDVVLVILSSVPLGSFLMYAVTKDTNRIFTPTEGLLIVLAQLLTAIQAFGSFYFYLIVSPAFRNNVRNMLRDILCFWKPRNMNQVAPSTVTATAIPTKTINATV